MADDFWTKTATKVSQDLQKKLGYEELKTILNGTPSGDLDEPTLMSCIAMILQNNQVR